MASVVSPSLSIAPTDNIADVSESGGDFFLHNANSHHLHYSLDDSKAAKICKLLSDKQTDLPPEELFHDTFFYLGKSSNGRTIWLRERRNLTKKSEPTWLVTESWESRSTLLRLNEYSAEQITDLLTKKGVTQDSDSTTPYIKFRFYRRSMKLEDYGTVHLDETLFGIILAFHVKKNPAQFNNVKNFADTHQLTPTSSKLTTMKKGGVVPAHLCGPRFDALENEDYQSDDDWKTEWEALVSAQSGTPPCGDHQFSDSPDSETAKARQLFIQMCFPKTEQDKTAED